VFSPKISGVAAGIGFILSFLLGIITGVSFPVMLIRAIAFAALFFALVSAGYWVIGRYLPELFDAVLDKAEAPTLGGQVDISIGDDTAGITPEFSTEGSLPDISLDDFMENPGESGGDTLDQNDEYKYTGMGDLEKTPFNGESLFDIEATSEKKGPEGEFSGKSAEKMASAIQTILKREDKG
jgi:hypothetical protein